MRIIVILNQFFHQIAQIYIKYKLVLLGIVLTLFAIYGLQQFLWSTQNSGIFVRTDSVAYLWSAENLAKGLGIGRIDGGGNFVPYNHWAPLYPTILAGLNLIGFTALDGARWLGGVLIVISILLIGLVIAKLTRNSPWYVLGGLLVLTSSTYFVDTNFYAMSEPLYIVLSLSALLLINRYMDQDNKIFLILASVLVGLTLLTRYVGVSLLIACLIVLLLQKHAWRKKVQDSLVMSGLALAPVAVWIVRNIRLTGIAANRTFSFYVISPDEWTQAGNQVLGWFSTILSAPLLGILKPIVILVFSFMVGLLYFRFVPQKPGGTDRRLLSLIAVYSLSYALFVLLARIMFDPDIPIYESRIQFPLLVNCIFLFIGLLHHLQVHIPQNRWIISVGVVSVYVLLAWVFMHGYRGEYLTETLIGHNAGLGLIRSTDTELVSLLEKYPLDKYRFYSDDIEKLYFESSNRLNSYSIYNQQPGEVEQLISKTSTGDVVIVIFDQKELGEQYQSKIPGLRLIYEGGANVYTTP